MWLSLVGLCSIVACGEDATPGGGTGTGGGTGGASTAPQGPLAKPGTAADPLAPSVLRAGPTTYYDSVKFLFGGANAPQRPVVVGTFPVPQVSVVRGRVLDEAGTPLPGVTVSAVGQPSWGSVTTRTDGFYDIAVVGGGTVGLRFTLAGALPSQRTTRVAWNRTETMRDVVLLAPSATSTAVTFGNAAWQVAAGDRIVDKSGARRAWIAIPPGTTAKAMDAKKVERDLVKGTLRLTEYTRGDRGKEAMPGDLPPRSAYTFAIAFGFDEAAEDRVIFDKPVYAYVEDFLGFPAGTIVPSGSFAGEQDVWDRETSGRVVGVVGSGAALGLDGTGDGQADEPASLGLASGELATVATFAPAGGRLWRVPLTHFSSHDFNWGTAPPAGATPPPRIDQPGGALADAPTNCTTIAGGGSTISCEDRVLGEDLPLVGTGLSLHYQSDRVDGRLSAFRFTVPVTPKTLIPGSRPPVVSVDILGQSPKIPAFPVQPSQSYTFTWDGRDGYARLWPMTAVATVSVSQGYDAVYSESVQFDAPPGVVITGTTARDAYSFTQRYEIPLGIYRAKTQGLGGWTLSAHHAYDVGARVLHLGSGGKVAATYLGAVTTRIAGQTESDLEQLGAADGLMGRAASLQDVYGLAQAPDGAVYFVQSHDQSFYNDRTDSRIRRLDPDGTVRTVAGVPTGGSTAEGAPALSARVEHAVGIAWFRGQVCFGELHRVRCLDEKQTVHTLYDAGVDAQIEDLAVGINKELYVSKLTDGIVRIAPDGTSAPFAGGGKNTGENVPATDAAVNAYGLAVLPDGSVAFSEPNAHRVRVVRPDGRVSTFAGTGEPGSAGDGGPATSARLVQPRALAALPTGALVISDWGDSNDNRARVRQVDPQGRMQTLAGGLPDDGPSEGPGLGVYVFVPTGILPQGDGSILYGDGDSIHRLTFPYPGASSGEVAVTEPGGSEIFVFDGGGRHLRTVDALTKTTRVSFTYDAAGLVLSATDDVGRKLTIERGADGNATAVVAPHGQRTTLAMDAAGYLQQVVDPLGRTDVLSHDAKGLLKSRTDARGGQHAMTYDEEGKLLTDLGPGGQTWKLQQNASATTSETLLTSAMGRVSRTTVTQSGAGNEIRTQTSADGTSVTTVQTPSSATTTRPDGTVLTQTTDPDPRWGMSAPFAKERTVTYPSGLKISTHTTREAVLEKPGDPHAIVSLTSTVSVGAGLPWKSAYEAASRTLTLKSASGRVARKQIDDHGRTLRVETPGVLAVERTYDAEGRPKTVTQGARSIAYTYTDTGYLGSVKDALGRTTTFQRDVAGRPTSTTLPGARVLALGFDENDNAISVTPPGKPVHAFGYTLDDLLDRATAPSNPPSTYAYDGDRALTLANREDGTKVKFTYDLAGRLAKTAYAEGEIVPSYDAKTGQPRSLTGPAAETLAFVHDGSHLVSVTSTGSVSGAVSWDYDERGRVSRDHVDGSNLAVEYDEDNLVAALGPVKLGRDAASGFVSSIQAAGTFEEIEHTLSENGTLVSYGEPTHWRVSSQGKALYDLALERDLGGRIVKRTELLEGTKRTFGYGYDDAGRLATVETDGVKTATYTYDANGNRLTEDGSSKLGTYDEQDRVTAYAGATFVHDARGNRMSRTEGGVTTSYDHDGLGALRKVKGGTTEITYAVDGLGRRVARSENGVVTHRWLYRNALQPAAEYDGAGKLRWRFVYATARHVPDAAIDGAGVVHRIVTDQVGSLRLVVRSSDGAVVQRMRNDAWGRVEEDFTIAGGSALPFGFAGGMFDRGTGLVHFGAREHDPGVGRWVEKDPVGFGGGLNLYGYASGRPLDLIDSDGLEPNDGPGTLLVPVDQGDYARNAASAGIAAGLAAGAGAATASGAYTFFGSQFRAFLPAAAAALRGCWTDPKLESSAIRASDLVKELNRLDRAAGTMRNTSSVLTEFFKKNADGGNVVITPGITRDLLLVYRQVALEAPQQAGIQADRLELIERALSNIP